VGKQWPNRYYFDGYFTELKSIWILRFDCIFLGGEKPNHSSDSDTRVKLCVPCATCEQDNNEVYMNSNRSLAIHVVQARWVNRDSMPTPDILLAQFMTMVAQHFECLRH
jgi:hypothetical protein